MLTYEQHKIFTDCAYQISSATLRGDMELSKTANKLDAYNMLLEPPATIKNANSDRIKNLREQARTLWDLHLKAHRAAEYINARPALCTYISAVNGSEQTYVLAGMLPDFEKAPKDEAQALQAVADYHACEAKTA